jgi:SAM-dependent methyltransferase
MLFIELVLIRGTAANVVYLSFFTNLVLLASFLGIGLGFLRAGLRTDRFRYAPGLLVALAAFVLLFPARIGPSVHGVPQLRGLFGTSAIPEWISLPLIFAGVVAVMAAVAQRVATLFARFEPLEAYRLDVMGSIAGIAAFSALSFVGADPLAWGVVIVVAFALLLRDETSAGVIASLAALVVLAAGVSFAPNDEWSPYQRVSFASTSADGLTPIFVNNRPHQTMMPLDVLLERHPFYEDPYSHLLRSGPGDVLIVGAGSGNDVALALAKGAGHVDAVEIDPALQRLGARGHPEQPYSDPRVTVHIDDGRAFLERTDRTYDLILFALPDSLTLVSGQGGLRLESYLFTREAVESVREHLRPGGVFSMYNYYRPDIFERYAATLTEVFGHAPCLDGGRVGAGSRSQSVLTVSVEAVGIACDTPWVQLGTAPEPATDDHPFPYLRSRTIPTSSVVALVLVLLASLVVVQRGAGRRIGEMRPFVDLFFMGAAFLLLETKSVVQFALLFGTTWFVNSLVFAGVLLSVLAAVEVVRRVRLPRQGILFLFLLGALVVAWSIPPSALLSLAPVPRFAAATGLAFAPVFLANLIFAQRFKDVGASTVAFGANLLGAMVGGTLEYASLVVGYRALLPIVGVLYLCAFLTEPERRRDSAGVAA